MGSLLHVVDTLAHQPLGSGRGKRVLALAQERGLPVHTEPIDWLSTERNVVIDLPGRREDVVYLVAHHDRTDANWFALASVLVDGVLHDVVSPTFGGRGAVDNATGVAVVMELAAWLATQERELSWRILFTGGEESGLRGSRAHVARLDHEEWDRVAAAVNVDSVGVSYTPNCVMSGASNLDLETWVLQASRRADVPLQVGKIPAGVSSDHAPFAKNGPLLDVGRGLLFNLPGGVLPQRSWFTPRDDGHVRRLPVVVLSGCEDMQGALDWLGALLVVPTGHIHGPRDRTAEVDATRLWEMWSGLRTWASEVETPEGADRLVGIR